MTAIPHEHWTVTHERCAVTLNCYATFARTCYECGFRVYPANRSLFPLLYIRFRISATAESNIPPLPMLLSATSGTVNKMRSPLV